MVIIFTERNNQYEKEIIEILKNHGADHYSDKTISENGGNLKVISIYKHTHLSVKNIIALFLENKNKFEKQIFPIGTIGICEDVNKEALGNFKKSNNTVITYGTNNKNTLTISSFAENKVLVTLQRTIINSNGKKIEPCEFKIKLTKQYSPYSILSSTAILILNGINPKQF